MNYNIKEIFGFYPNIKSMLDGLPEEIWPSLLPENQDNLISLELSISIFRKRQRQRNQAMAIQRRHDFPIRPNQPLREVIIRSRIQRMKDKKSFPKNGE